MRDIAYAIPLPGEGQQQPASIDDRKGSVVIGPGVNFGTNVLVIGPSRIGEGAVIASDSVVVGDLDPFDIYAGNPARSVGGMARGGGKVQS